MKAIFKVILYVGIIISSLFASNLELYKINYYNPSSYIFRRIREIQTKEELVINYFVEELKAEFGSRILETHLVPEKEREKSGINMVIIYDEIERKRILSSVENLISKIFKEYNELIIPIVLSKELLDTKNISIEDIFKFIEEEPDFGFHNPEKATVEDFYKMGKIDLDSANTAYKKYEQTGKWGYLYSAFRNIFFANEQFMRAVILHSSQEFAKSHRKILEQFLNLPPWLPKRIKRKVRPLMSTALIRRITYFYEGRKYTKEDAKYIKEMLRVGGMLKKFIEKNILS